MTLWLEPGEDGGLVNTGMEVARVLIPDKQRGEV